MTGREDTVAPGSLQGTHPRTKEHRFSVMRVQGYDQFARGDAKRLWTQRETRTRRQTLFDQQRSCPVRNGPGKINLSKSRLFRAKTLRLPAQRRQARNVPD